MVMIPYEINSNNEVIQQYFIPKFTSNTRNKASAQMNINTMINCRENFNG